jgi:hypothetical protein
MSERTIRALRPNLPRQKNEIRGYARRVSKEDDGDTHSGCRMDFSRFPGNLRKELFVPNLLERNKLKLMLNNQMTCLAQDAK